MSNPTVVSVAVPGITSVGSGIGTTTSGGTPSIPGRPAPNPSRTFYGIDTPQITVPGYVPQYADIWVRRTT